MDASPFELLTVTAFEIFNRERVSVGVVEVGMGGRDDATNILKDKAVTVIANIDLDHQDFLGNTVGEITRNKCGIFKPGVPVVYDATNAPGVICVIKEEAVKVGAGPLYGCNRLPLGGLYSKAFTKFGKKLSNRRAHRVNIAVAWKAGLLLLEKLGIAIEPHKLALFEAVRTASWPGRYQEVDLVNLVGTTKKVLVDGAHNEKAAQNLGFFVEREYRGAHNLRDHGGRRLYVLPVTWVIAASSTKDIRAMLKHYLKPEDRVIAVEFGPVDGMTFVKPLEADKIVETAEEVVTEENGALKEARSFGTDVKGALKYAVDTAGNDAVVVAGSLYLVSDVFRLLRDANAKDGAVPVADLWTGRTEQEGRTANEKKRKRLVPGRKPGRPKGSKNRRIKSAN